MNKNCKTLSNYFKNKTKLWENVDYAINMSISKITTNKSGSFIMKGNEIWKSIYLWKNRWDPKERQKKKKNKFQRIWKEMKKEIMKQ